MPTSYARQAGKARREPKILSIFTKCKWGGGICEANDGGVSTLAPLPLRQRLGAAATSPFVAFAKNGEDLV